MMKIGCDSRTPTHKHGILRVGLITALGLKSVLAELFDNRK